jgi:hypothetical protein
MIGLLNKSKITAKAGRVKAGVLLSPRKEQGVLFSYQSF